MQIKYHFLLSQELASSGLQAKSGWLLLSVSEIDAQPYPLTDILLGADWGWD